jgi:hypothetical protein
MRAYMLLEVVVDQEGGEVRVDARKSDSEMLRLSVNLVEVRVSWVLELTYQVGVALEDGARGEVEEEEPHVLRKPICKISSEALGLILTRICLITTRLP